MASVWQPVRNRSAVVAVLAALAVSSCNPHQDEKAAAPENAVSESAPVPHSALGDFLAGWLAHADGDNRAAAHYFASALDRDPDNLDIMQRAFTLMVAEGKLDAAAPLAERLVELDAQSPLPLLVLGVRDARDDRYAEAEKHFAALRKHGVNAFLEPLLTAWSLVGEGKTDAALETLKPLTETVGLRQLGAFHTGLIDDLADRTAAAEQEYTLALADQLNIRTVEAAGSLYQRTGHDDRAKQLYDRYRAEHPETLLFDGGQLLKAGVHAPRAVGGARSGLAEALFDSAALMRQGDANDLAMVFCQLALALQPDFPLAQMTMADILSREGHRTEANTIYRAIDPTSPVHDFGQLQVALNLDDSGDPTGALDVLGHLVRERPDSVDTLITLGDVQRRHKHYAEAAQAYTEALARIGDTSEAWALYYSRGVAFERLGQWSKAEPDFLKALKIMPDQPDVLNYLGYSWIDQGTHLERARAMIERAVSLRPTDGAIVDSLGWALYKMGKYPEAVAQLERAVELRPVDATINEHLGDAYWQAGRRNEARYQWRRALEMDPEPEDIAGLKERISTGRLPSALSATP
ncbi:MAG: tetratricopeptide repeat protein [Magnetospirillum sp.]|nr:tetratricopeptide repeat protein [Magnetospirillum sp.]